MKIKVVLAILVLLSLFNTCCIAMTEEVRGNTVVESKFLGEQSSDDFEMLSYTKTTHNDSLLCIVYESDLKVATFIPSKIFKPPKQPLFIS